MSYVAFATAFLASAVLFLAGLEKVFNPARGATRAWKPALVGGSTAIVLVWLLGVAETLIALAGFLPLMPRSITITTIAVFAAQMRWRWKGWGLGWTPLGRVGSAHERA